MMTTKLQIEMLKAASKEKRNAFLYVPYVNNEGFNYVALGNSSFLALEYEKLVYIKDHEYFLHPSKSLIENLCNNSNDAVNIRLTDDIKRVSGMTLLTFKDEDNNNYYIQEKNLKYFEASKYETFTFKAIKNMIFIFTGERLNGVILTVINA